MAFVRSTVLPLLAALFLSACGDATEPEPVPDVTGTWTGVGSAGFNNFWDLTLRITIEPSGKVGGTAHLAPVVPQQGLSAHDFVVRWGAYGYPDILVTLAKPDFVDVNYSGEVIHGDTIDGLMNGSAFRNVPITLHRVVP